MHACVCVCFMSNYDKLWCSLRSANYKTIKWKQQLPMVDHKKQKTERKTNGGNSLNPELVTTSMTGNNFLQHRHVHQTPHTNCSFETFFFFLSSKNRRGQNWYLPKSSPLFKYSPRVSLQTEKKILIISCLSVSLKRRHVYCVIVFLKKYSQEH